MKWFKVALKKPEPFEPVFCYTPGDRPFLSTQEGYMGRNRKWYVGGIRREDGAVTHWAKLPTFQEIDWFDDAESNNKPKFFGPVLVYMPDEQMPVRQGFICASGKWYAGGKTRDDEEVTHWAKLPSFGGEV